MPRRPGSRGAHHELQRTYLAIAACAAAIFAFTASRLKLAPLCIKGEVDRRHRQLLDLLLDENKAPELVLRPIENIFRAPSWDPLFGRLPCARKDEGAKVDQDYGTSGSFISPEPACSKSMKRYLKSYGMRTARNSLSPKMKISCGFDGALPLIIAHLVVAVEVALEGGVTDLDIPGRSSAIFGLPAAATKVGNEYRPPEVETVLDLAAGALPGQRPCSSTQKPPS